MVLYFDDSVLDLMGEILKIKCRLSHYNCLSEFKSYAQDFFEPFNSRQTQNIVLRTLELDIDLDYISRERVVLDHFHLHNRDRERILVSWHKYKWRLAFGFISGKFLENLQPLNFIKDYYGEKYGFYFAWLIHYTGQLILPSIVGIGIFIYQLVHVNDDGKGEFAE